MHFAVLPVILGAALPAHAQTTLRVMSNNIWSGGANDGKPIDETTGGSRGRAKTPRRSA